MVEENLSLILFFGGKSYVRHLNRNSFLSVTTQPVSFNPTCLDADSLKIYNNLTTTHKTGAKITSEVNKAGRQLLTDVPQQASTRVCIFYIYTVYMQIKMQAISKDPNAGGVPVRENSMAAKGFRALLGLFCSDLIDQSPCKMGLVLACVVRILYDD